MLSDFCLGSFVLFSLIPYFRLLIYLKVTSIEKGIIKDRFTDICLNLLSQ